jgi:hypothetical protein
VIYASGRIWQTAEYLFVFSRLPACLPACLPAVFLPFSCQMWMTITCVISQPEIICRHNAATALIHYWWCTQMHH